jgi:hypothetical protein
MTAVSLRATTVKFARVRFWLNYCEFKCVQLVASAMSSVLMPTERYVSSAESIVSLKYRLHTSYLRGTQSQKNERLHVRTQVFCSCANVCANGR